MFSVILNFWGKNKVSLTIQIIFENSFPVYSQKKRNSSFHDIFIPYWLNQVQNEITLLGYVSIDRQIDRAYLGL